MTPEVNERDTVKYRAVFKDADEAPIVPGTAHWRLDCATTGVTLTDWTAVAVLTEVDDFGALTMAYATVDVPAELNVMQDACNRRELKRLLVAADVNTSYEQKQQASYYVNNLLGRT